MEEFIYEVLNYADHKFTLINDCELVHKYKNCLFVNCSFYSIINLTDLPTNIVNLNCSNNKIKELNDLPITLKVLNCCNNKITQLNNLPCGLEILDCSHNELINLDWLPNSLLCLYCVGCDICSLDNLPNSILEIVCYNNKINELLSLPNGLKKLNIWGNEKLKNFKNINLSNTELEILCCEFENHYLDDDIELLQFKNLPKTLNLIKTNGFNVLTNKYLEILNKRNIQVQMNF